MATLNELGHTLLAQLYEIITGGDEHISAESNKFVSWCLPGIAFSNEDFDFAARGLGSGADAEQEKLLLQQAYSFATLTDFIPTVEGTYQQDEQQKVFRTSEARLSHIYGEILRASKVVSQELSDNEKAKIEKFRNLLRTKKTVKDLVTDEEKEITEDGAVLKAYKEKQSAFIDAALIYNAKRVAAQSASGVEGKSAVTDWANNAVLYRMKVKTAEDAWASGGYRNEVDAMNGFIDQVSQKDMVLWKQKLLEYYDDATVSALGPGQEFKFTTLIPGNFAFASGWTDYTITHEQTSTTSQKKTRKWDASGGFQSAFGLKASAGGESETESGNKNISSFKMSFQLAQTMISRPWFYPEFFINRGWTLTPGGGWTFSDMPSDGQEPPKGIMVGYPTSILFIRNIVIESADFVEAYNNVKSSFQAGGSVGWGPIKLGGNYGSTSEKKSINTTTDGATLKVDGMQAIAFINHLIDKCPNPLPDLKPEDFH